MSGNFDMNTDSAVNEEAIDAIDKQADADGDNAVPSAGDFALKPEGRGLLAISFFCALAGLLFGPLPAVLLAFITGKVFYPLFAVVPLLIGFLSLVLNGSKDVRGIIVGAVFSLAGAYLTALSCQAAIYAAALNMAVFEIPLIAILSIGKPGILPMSASAFVYPLLFTAFGVTLSSRFS